MAGRRPAFDTKKEQHARALFQAGQPIPRIVHALGISRATFYRYQSSWRTQVLTVGILDRLGASVNRYNGFPLGSTAAHFDIQVVKLVAENLGARIHFKPVPLPKLFRGVEAGAFDLAIGQLGSSAEREKLFRVSEPYGNLGDAPNIALVAARLSRVSPMRLNGRIATIAESFCAEWLAQQRVDGANVFLFGRPQSVEQALLSKRVEAAVLSYPEAVAFVAAHAHFNIKPPLISQGGRKAVILLNRDNDRLHDRVSTAIAGLARSHVLDQIESPV